MNQITLAEIAPFNPYFTEYCKHRDTSAAGRLDTMDYMVWIHAKHTAFRKMTGWPEVPGNLQYQAAFIAWLNKEVPNEDA